MGDPTQAERNRMRAEAEKAALQYAPSGEALIAKWQGYDGGPPETFDYPEAVAAIVFQLNKEGVTAWNGDATYCIAIMLHAQYRRWAACRAELAYLRDHPGWVAPQTRE